MELEHAADDHRDQRLLHLDPVGGHVAIEPVLAVQLDHAGVQGAHALVESPGHVELLVRTVERVPVVRVPVVAVHQIRPNEGPDGAELPDAPHELPARQVDVVHGQHRDELQALGAVLAEVVDPVVVGLAEGQREQGIQVVARDEREAGGRVEDRDVDPLHIQPHDLRLGVVVALDGEVQPAGVGDPRSREGLSALRRARAAPLPVLLQVGVRGGQPVDEDQAGRAATRAAVDSHRHADAVLERRVQIALEEVRRFHDVHVGVDEPEAIFHDILLGVTLWPGIILARVASRRPEVLASVARPARSARGAPEGAD